MKLGFPEVVLLIGLVLVLIAALSGPARGPWVSISAVAVAAGMLMQGLGITSVSPERAEIVAVIELALIFTLFSDGQAVERELLFGNLGPATRALALAMPATMVLIALLAKLLFDSLSWAEAFLLGAVLAPTDAVITSSVVSASGLPARLRHTLNLESGLNDGLALPFVLVFIAAAVGDASATGAGVEVVELLGEAAAGGLIGFLLATIAGRALAGIPGLRLTPKYEGIFALGIALAAYGLAEVTIGNGFIAAFVAGLALAVADRETPDAFHDFNESIGAILQAVTFFVFGALVIDAGVPSPWVAVAALVLWTLLVARPAAILASMVGTDLEPLERRFIAWFGPKGVASMLFALFVLKSGVPDAELIFQLASLVILVSIIAHGFTDTIGSRWLERRLGAESEPGSG